MFLWSLGEKYSLIDFAHAPHKNNGSASGIYWIISRVLSTRQKQVCSFCDLAAY